MYLVGIYIGVVIIETLLLCKMFKDEIGLNFTFFLLSFLIASTVFVLPIFALIGFVQNLFQNK